jgi:hypothetical protein
MRISELSQALIEDITCVLSELEHLESLNLVSIIQVEPIEFMDLLHHAHFPNLLSFGLTVKPQTLSLLPSFLNRHQTITDLSLIPVAHLDSEPLDPILLPNLKEYFGPSSFTSSFDLTSGSVSQVSLLWHPGDLLETPFSHLSKIASLQTFNGISTSADIGDSDILASAATHLPHIQTLEIRGMEDVAARISPVR